MLYTKTGSPPAENLPIFYSGDGSVSPYDPPRKVGPEEFTMDATPDNTLADPEQKQAMSLIRPALREYRTWAINSSRWKGFG